MPRISRLTGDTICLFAATFLAVAASTVGQAAPRDYDASAPLNHDRQHVVLRDHANVRHDRAPCPSDGGVPG